MERAESSVLFNLAEVMKLEQERVAAEQAAGDAAQKAAEQARAECVRQQEQRAARVQAEAQALADDRRLAVLRAEQEREIVLLRAQLERETARREHAARAAASEASVRRSSVGRRADWGVVAAACAAVAAGYFLWLDPRLAELRDGVAAAEARAAGQVRELTLLQRRMSEQAEKWSREATEVRQASSEPGTRVVPVPASTERRVKTQEARPQRGQRRMERAPREHEEDPLDVLDRDLQSGNDDPLRGLEDPVSSKVKRLSSRRR
jgi:hypothetical protein